MTPRYDTQPAQDPLNFTSCIVRRAYYQAPTVNDGVFDPRKATTVDEDEIRATSTLLLSENNIYGNSVIKADYESFLERSSQNV